ncbi:AmmeMemoRadiSam system protein B [Candidatus Uhrbacteria bacterium]|nr:AmmeMemoRadiSam system protein B [Candidatus Uhrbacteria bacterium]MBD3284259.1 AmmeMemoRadiSam system protein B [Candidatus Uhrbacteria bacterium]
MLVLSAIVPHSPLLAQTIGKQKRDALHATLKAFVEIEERLYTKKIETVVMISPHAAHYPDAFSANMAPSFTGTLKTFGDHDTHVNIPADIALLDTLQRQFRTTEHLPFTLSSNEELDYGFTIPLLLLSRHLKNTKLVPLAPSQLGPQSHLEFGQELRRIIDETSTRTAFIASADLSHRLTEHSPGGMSVEGPAFDATIRAKLAAMDTEGLLSMDLEAIEAAGQCGYLPIVTLAGLLDGTNTTYRELCYEAPFGVGYLTALIDS